MMKQTNNRRFPLGLYGWMTGVILLWQVVAWMKLVDSAFLPSPARVAMSFLTLFASDFWWKHLLPSVVRVFLAFLFSIFLAFPLGMACGQSPRIAQVLYPLFSFTRYLPVPSLVPLCILYFGVGDAQKIAVITLGVVFQLVFLLADDSSSIPQELLDAGRTFGLSSWESYRRIVFPAAMPAVWNDLRIAAGLAWSYLVLAELVAGDRGVGYFVVQSQRFLYTDRVFAGILYIGLLGAFTDYIFRKVGARMFPWV